MNTEDAPLRKVRQLRGYGALAVAAVFAVVFLWWAPIASASVAVEIAIVIVIGLCGGVQLWLAHRKPPDTRVASLYSDPNRLPLPDRERYFRRQLLGCALLFPVLSAWIAYELNLLEEGSRSPTPLWFPVRLLYEHFGYWPALLAAPLAGATLLMFWVWKLRQLPR